MSNVRNVSTKNQTIVKRVRVGKPVRRVNPRVTNINLLDGVDAINRQDGFILIYNETTGNWEARANTASSNINSLTGVNTSNKVDGSVLVYNATTEDFEATTSLEEQTINGGQY